MSTHLTTFTGGFIVLPAPTNWNYVFEKGDLLKSDTIYMAVIGASVLYLASKILFEIISTTFGTDGLIEAQSLRCPIVLALFILRVVFVCMSMFLVIMNDSSRYGRHNTDQLQSNDGHEIIMFITRNLPRSLGRSA